MSPFMSFDRERWSELRNLVPMTLSESDLKELQGINEKLTMDKDILTLVGLDQHIKKGEK